MKFFTIPIDHEYMQKVFCSMYVPNRWNNIDEEVTPLQIIELNLKKVPLPNPKAVMDLFLLASEWYEGWLIIKDELIDWLISRDNVPDYIKGLDWDKQESRAALSEWLNSNLLFACTDYRLKVIEIIKEKEGVL